MDLGLTNMNKTSNTLLELINTSLKEIDSTKYPECCSILKKAQKRSKSQSYQYVVHHLHIDITRYLQTHQYTAPMPLINLGLVLEKKQTNWRSIPSIPFLLSNLFSK